jgi:acetolactate synthase small subunit|tara:strand:- start:5258 stop:6928 length:1671 start_codon:yes stop_codon:yes gene_type:complete
MFNNPNNVRMMNTGGIMASSPELMNAVKGYNIGGINAIPVLNQKIPNQATLSGFRRTLPFTAMNTLGSRIDDNIGVEIKDETPLEVLKREQEEKNKTVDTSLETKPKLTQTTTDDNDPNKFGVKKLKPILANFKKEKENITTPDKKETDSSLFDTSKDMEITNQMMARNRRALTDMASLDDKQLLGTTANQTQKDLIAELEKEGREVTLADVRDKAISILGFDPEKIEENFDEDRRSALFLRVMQAGLAVASGESDNALTNIAKGLNVGLSGYGDDIKFLSKEMKADRREAANTMYKLLGDAKSEQIAKETLALKKKMNINQILQTKVGEEKDMLVKQVELQNANDTLKLNFIKSMRDLDFKEKKFNIEQEQFDQSLNATLRKLPSDEVRQLYESGLVTLTDPNKGLVPGNFTVAPEGQKILKGVLTEEFGGKLLAKQRQSIEQKILSEEGKVKGIVMGESFDKKSFGIKANDFVDKYNDLDSDDDMTGITLDYLDLSQEVGGKINLSEVPLRIKEELLRPPSAAQVNRGETETLLEKYANRFNENDDAFKKEFGL